MAKRTKTLKGAKNTLYYGDNLHVMQRYLGDASVDLIYLDPPFKSDKNYNVLFKKNQMET
jgi:site-specific DNA-methyltransferase (adenine-specific)